MTEEPYAKLANHNTVTRMNACYLETMDGDTFAVINTKDRTFEEVRELFITAIEDEFSIEVEDTPKDLRIIEQGRDCGKVTAYASDEDTVYEFTYHKTWIY